PRGRTCRAWSWVPASSADQSSASSWACKRPMRRAMSSSCIAALLPPSVCRLPFIDPAPDVAFELWRGISLAYHPRRESNAAVWWEPDIRLRFTGDRDDVRKDHL